MKVLIVDGSILISERLFELITDARPETSIRKTTTFRDTVEILTSYTPDLLIIDLHLPENTAIEIIKQTRLINNNIMVIVLSLAINEHIEQRCKKNNVNYLLDKYKDFDKIPAILNRIPVAKKESQY